MKKKEKPKSKRHSKDAEILGAIKKLFNSTSKESEGLMKVFSHGYDSGYNQGIKKGR